MLLGLFVLIAALGTLTVLWPELAEDPDDENTGDVERVLREDGNGPEPQGNAP
jgi:nitrogen fixation-related uncharacterized protein